MNKVFLIFSLLFISCVQQVSKDYAKDFVVPNIQPIGTEKYLDLNSDYIFDQESLPSFELKIPGSSLRKIDSDPVKEEYVEGNLSGDYYLLNGFLNNPNCTETDKNKINES